MRERERGRERKGYTGAACGRRRSDPALKGSGWDRCPSSIVSSLGVTRNEQERAQKKHLSFNQKEKRKRDAGQATSGKNFVEEEKRMLREAGGN